MPFSVSNRTSHTVTIDGNTYLTSFPVIRVDQGEPIEHRGCPLPAVMGGNPFTPQSIEAAAEQIIEDGADVVIVARVVLSALMAHPDAGWGGSAILRALERAACPDTSPASVIRDETGQIIGVRRVVVAPYWQERQ